MDFIDALALRNIGSLPAGGSAINHAALSDEAAENIAEVLQDTATGIDELALALMEVHDGVRRAHLRTATAELGAVAGRLHPHSSWTCIASRVEPW